MASRENVIWTIFISMCWLLSLSSNRLVVSFQHSAMQRTFHIEEVQIEFEN